MSLRNANVLNWSDWDAVTFGAAKFQVDVKKGGKEGGRGGLTYRFSSRLAGEEVNMSMVP